MRRHVALLLLAFNSGAIDAIGFVALGGAFTSVMTGNMILLGIAATQADAALAARSGLAIVLFMAGAYLGARIAGPPRDGDPPWPRPATWALLTELAILAAVAAGWWAGGGHPHGNVQLLLLGADAIALGIQSSAILRFGVPGLSTTYMTGTLTGVVAALAQGRHPRQVAESARILVALIAGAGAATLLAGHAPMLVPLLQLVPVGLAVAIQVRIAWPSRSGAQPRP
ncbi:YoaK family protein [Dactylosporangium sp. NPDC000244]|uniref:YoaK family protein n=1 Tax=Dactylosporangium sp. NPDC000244 TaxID=3154365 RepID=UPI00332BA7F0